MTMPGRFPGLPTNAIVPPDVFDRSDNRHIAIHNSTVMSGVIAALFAAIFLLDVFTPLGLPLSVLYIVPLALTSLLQRREAPYWLAGAASAATLCDYLLSSSIGGIPSWLPVINHGICLALFWLTAVVIRRQQDRADHLIHVATLEAENLAHLAKQQVLQRQADEIQDLYNRAPCGYHSLDATGRYIEVNDTELQWLGCRREDLVGQQRFQDLLTPPSIRRFDEVFPRFVAQGSIHDLELDLVRKDGSLLPISLSATALRDSEGRYIASRSTIVDVTERRRTEKLRRQTLETLERQVRERTAALRQKSVLIELSHEPIFSWDVEGGILEWNRGCEELYGFTRAEAVNRRSHDLLTTVFPGSLDDIMTKLRLAGEWTGELFHRTKDHRIVTVESRWSYIDQDGRRIVLETNRDITERKKAETVLINKNKDLETLLYVTSHDLKEPLRAIESFSQLVLERYADRIDASGGDYLRRVVRATQRLDRLLNDILELSRAQRMLPPMEDVEAEILVKEALTRLDARIQETGAAVQIVYPLPRLCVNRMWATQGLYNLLANAMKFTRNGHAPDIEITSYEAPASTTPVAGLVVKDRGPGVPAQHAERIFMLFQRAVGRNVEGTGAGLTIVRQVAERHGGRAWVQPRAGGGSEFVMTFANPTHNGNGEASAA
ncbi:MAG: PAS domain S-box protein [Nitrospira sp.]